MKTLLGELLVGMITVATQNAVKRDGWLMGACLTEYYDGVDIKYNANFTMFRVLPWSPQLVMDHQVDPECWCYKCGPGPRLVQCPVVKSYDEYVHGDFTYEN